MCIRDRYHHDSLTREKALQEDLRRAERLGNRVGQVIEHLRKDFSGIRNFITKYNFASTVGADATPIGDCAGDLSAAIHTRLAWKRDLSTRIIRMVNYVMQQYLGDYLMLYDNATYFGFAVAAPAPSACVDSGATSCCPARYAPTFMQHTPLGDCLQSSKSQGAAPAATRMTTIQNPNLMLGELRDLICGDFATDPLTNDVKYADASSSLFRAWFLYLSNLVNGNANVGDAQTAVAASNLPQNLRDKLAEAGTGFVATQYDAAQYPYDSSGSSNGASEISFADYLATNTAQWDEIGPLLPHLWNAEDEGDFELIKQFINLSLIHI